MGNVENSNIPLSAVSQSAKAETSNVIASARSRTNANAHDPGISASAPQSPPAPSDASAPAAGPLTAALPVVAANMQAAQATEKSMVLCADEDPDTLAVLRRTLRKAGYRTVTASTGWGAVGLALQALPDLILLDVALPDLDGYEVMKAVAKLIPGKLPPVVLLSAASSKDDKLRGYFSGAAYCVTKPLAAETIVTAAKYVLGNVKDDERHRVLESLTRSECARPPNTTSSRMEEGAAAR